MSTPRLLFTPSYTPFKKRRRWYRRSLPILAAVIIVLIGAGIGTWFLFTFATSTHTVVGQFAFLSTGQANTSIGSQGIADQVQVDLSITESLAAGKSYYAWLLPDKDNQSALLLGTVFIHGKTGHLLYSDDQHNNLLAQASRLLITEEKTTPAPHLPSRDRNTWRYLAQIPQTLTPGSGQQYSMLDHLRHLLAEDPTLKTHGLPGGLAPWLHHNTGMVDELATNAKDSWHSGTKSNLLRPQLIQMLAYLDGTSYVARDLPATTTIPTIADPTERIGLLEYEPEQNPAGYLKHVALHTNGVASAPGSNSELRAQAAQITSAISYITTQLEKVRQDTRQLVVMSDQQLQQVEAGKLLDAMASNASLAYNGQGDGVEWAYLHIQRLATMDITTT